MNRVILFGHLGADPELKRTQGGTAILKLRLATNEQVKRNDKWEPHTEWHSITVWGRRAEALAKIVSKGTPLLIEGSLRTSSWEDNDGNKRYRTEINASDVKLTAKREGGGGRSGGDDEERSSRSGKGKSKKDDEDDVDFDEIPF